MRTNLALLLAVLLVLVLAGCGSSGNPPATATPAAALPQGSSPDAPAATEPAQAEPPFVFEEITVVDNDCCTVRITGIEPDDVWGYALKVYLENKSPDRTYMFSVTDGAVNGVVWDPFFAAKVAPGKKANDTIRFSDSEKAALLQEFTDVELTLRVYDSEDWSADDAANETVHIYPLGEDKAASYVREPQPTDTVIVDDNRISIVVTGYRTDKIWGYTADLYLVNKTDKTLMFSANDVSVNGFMCDPFWATDVAPGKVAFSSMNWSDSAFGENGITTVEEIELSLRVYDRENWSAGNVYEETVTLVP